MAGDLEDFLRRAAERRQQKAAQGGGAPPPQQPQRQPPRQYTDARRERQVRQVDEPIMAEVVDDVTDATLAKQRKVEAAKQLAARARQAATRKAAKAEEKVVVQRAEKKARKSRERAEARTAELDKIANETNVALDLIHLIKKPGGIQQAILLREILERPDFDRW